MSVCFAHCIVFQGLTTKTKHQLWASAAQVYQEHSLLWLFPQGPLLDAVLKKVWL